jgi:hypothetical protein
MRRSDRIYIVLEGVSAEVILRRLLSPLLIHLSRFVRSQGKTAAISTARTLLALSKGPVALVVDADTLDQGRVQTNRQTITELLEAAPHRMPYQLFLAIPDLNTIASEGGPPDQIPLVRQLKDFIESSVIVPLDVSLGQILRFTANGMPASGVVVGSEQTTGAWASVIVETETQIPEGAQLAIPDLPETGGCGLAYPVQRDGRTRVMLSIGYNYIDVSTIGR